MYNVRFFVLILIEIFIEMIFMKIILKFDQICFLFQFKFLALFWQIVGDFCDPDPHPGGLP